MFGAFDKSFCPNKTCPKKDTCGRHYTRIKGEHYIATFMFMEPNPDGTCDYEMPYEEVVVPKWMEELALKYEEERKVQDALEEEKKDSQSLDSSML